jgi:hypothetical protein
MDYFSSSLNVIIISGRAFSKVLAAKADRPLDLYLVI